MRDECRSCPQRPALEAEYGFLRESLCELKDRVRRVEISLTRGVMLLVANLVGIVMTLAREFLQR